MPHVSRVQVDPELRLLPVQGFLHLFSDFIQPPKDILDWLLCLLATC